MHCRPTTYSSDRPLHSCERLPTGPHTRLLTGPSRVDLSIQFESSIWRRRPVHAGLPGVSKLMFDRQRERHACTMPHTRVFIGTTHDQPGPGENRISNMHAKPRLQNVRSLRTKLHAVMGAAFGQLEVHGAHESQMRDHTAPRGARYGRAAGTCRARGRDAGMPDNSSRASRAACTTSHPHNMHARKDCAHT